MLDTKSMCCHHQASPFSLSCLFLLGAPQVSQPPQEQSEDLPVAFSIVLAAVCTSPVGMPGCLEAKEQVRASNPVARAREADPRI